MKPEKDHTNQNRSYLDTANDWEVRVDLKGRLKIPSSITITDLRPDMILISESTKQLGIIELTVPNESRIEVSGEMKRAKYAPIVEEGTRKGWLESQSVDSGSWVQGIPCTINGSIVERYWLHR